MPLVLACPSCATKVRVPENLLGTTVRCPSCQNEFTAQEPAGGGANVQPEAAPRPARKKDYDYEEGSSRRGGGRYPRQERSTLVLILGIAGVVLTVLSCIVGPAILLAFPVSLVAWLLGRSDLKAIANGEMDPKAEGATKGGWICGIIGTCVSALLFVAICVFIIIWVALFGFAASTSVH